MLTSKELDVATDLIHQGIEESAFAGSKFDRDAFKAYVTEHPDNLLVVREGSKIVGVLFFVISEGLFMSGIFSALEVAWNVAHGITGRAKHWFKLLELFEEKAEEMGADLITISSYMPRMDEMYLKRGWVNDYKTFIKDLR